MENLINGGLSQVLPQRLQGTREGNRLAAYMLSPTVDFVKLESGQQKIPIFLRPLYPLR
jgi:hypothetical protein